MPLISSFGLLKAINFGLSTIRKSTLAVAHDVTPFISVYPWSAGFGTKYANPSTLSTGNSIGVSFNPSGTAIAVAHATSPFISTYPWSAGFGTKYANPSTLPTGTGADVSFSD